MIIIVIILIVVVVVIIISYQERKRRKQWKTLPYMDMVKNQISDWRLFKVENFLYG